MAHTPLGTYPRVTAFDRLSSGHGSTSRPNDSARAFVRWYVPSRSLQQLPFFEVVDEAVADAVGQEGDFLLADCAAGVIL